MQWLRQAAKLGIDGGHDHGAAATDAESRRAASDNGTYVNGIELFVDVGWPTFQRLVLRSHSGRSIAIPSSCSVSTVERLVFEPFDYLLPNSGNSR